MKTLYFAMLIEVPMKIKIIAAYYADAKQSALEIGTSLFFFFVFFFLHGSRK